MPRPPEPADQEGFARAVVTLLEARGLVYAIGGSVAAMEYGEPRFTIDIDIMVHAGATELAAFLHDVDGMGVYAPPVEALIETYITHGTPFNLIDGRTGARADIYVAREEGLAASAMQRRQRRVWDVASRATAWFLSPEDVILFKLVYFHQGGHVAQKHTTDIAKMLVTMGMELDRDYIEDWSDRLGVADVWRVLWTSFVNASGTTPGLRES